jgi:plastocyanin
MPHVTKGLRGTLLIAFALSALTFGANAAETMINQKNLKFVPDTVTINAGDTIRFTNSDRFSHDVTIVNPDGTSDDKGLMKYKEEFAVSFAKPGTYKIHDRLHPAMTAVVTVKQSED